MAWAALIVAGLLEVVWAYAMKLSQGFSKPGPSVVTIVAMIVSFTLLSYAMKSLPLGTAYTIWTGIGAVGAFGVGVLVLHEPASAIRILAACLVIGGLVLFRVAEGRA
jgi:quaternary ammonium compound-resistance protein SugE